MIFCIDIGNSDITFCVFNQETQLITKFSYATAHVAGIDPFGIMLLLMLQQNNISKEEIKKIGIASVVPRINFIITQICLKYFKIKPIFLEHEKVKNITFKVDNPSSVGADLLAGAIYGAYKYPNNELIIFDIGTASTAIYLNSKNEFIGALIAPGIRLMRDSLADHTAKLFNIAINSTDLIIGKNTNDAILSGIKQAQLGFMNQVITDITKKFFLKKKPFVIMTGGYVPVLFNNKNDILYDEYLENLVCLGIKIFLDDIL